MNYLKYFLIFCVLGFIMESVVYKVSGSNSHSGVLLGPYTLVYGIGGLLVIILNNYLNKLPINSICKFILLFICFTIICTLTEYIIGNLIHFIFDIDKWDYTNHKYHFGKYIALDLAITWGILSMIIIKVLKPFIDNLLLIIPTKSALIFFAVMLIDLIYNLFTKAFKY